MQLAVGKSCWTSFFPDWSRPWTVPGWTLFSTLDVLRYCCKPLGQILATALTPDDVPVEPVASYYTRPTKEPAGAAPSHKEFWTGARRLPSEPATASQARGYL